MENGFSNFALEFASWRDEFLLVPDKLQAIHVNGWLVHVDSPALHVKAWISHVNCDLVHVNGRTGRIERCVARAKEKAAGKRSAAWNSLRRSEGFFG